MTTILLAKFWGIFMLVFSLLFALVPKALDRMFSYVQDEKMMFMLGFLSFMMGLINVLLHNVWGDTLQIMVSLFGWFALVKGVLRMSFPRQVAVQLQKMNFPAMRALLFVVAIIGGFLIYCAYESGYSC